MKEKYISSVEEHLKEVDKLCDEFVFNDEVEEIINLTNLENPFRGELIESLDETLIGQKKAKELISDIIGYSVIKMKKNKGPLGTLFLHGPTGVGKTESVKALSKVLFGVDNGYIRIACEEYQKSHKAEKFAGAPPGYIGYDDGGVFDSKTFYNAFDIATKSGKLNSLIKGIGPINIVLFDEIEKAHEMVHQAMLGIFGEGKLNLSNPKKLPIDFGNTIIIITSNIGEHSLAKKKDEKVMGYSLNKNKSDQEINIDRKNIFNSELKDTFSPEWLNRIDGFVRFEKLNKEELKKVIDLNIKEYEDSFNSYYLNYPDINISMDDDIYEKIIEEGYDEEKGARDLVRGYTKMIENKIDLYIYSYFKKYDTLLGNINLNLYLEGGEIILKSTLKSTGKNIQKLLPSVDVKYNYSEYISVIDGDIVNLDELIRSYGISNIGDLTTYYKGKSIYILNSKKYSEKMIDLEKIIGPATNLNGILLDSLGFKSNNIETLILKLASNIGLNDTKLEQLLLLQLYASFEKICLITTTSMPSLIEELIPIIIRTVNKIKK